MSAASSAPRQTTMDAMSYLKVVKERFQDKGDQFKDFLDIMKDFKARRINTSVVVGKVKELFREEPDLILGFNVFLPKGCEAFTPSVDFDEAISFLNKLKGNDHVYITFLDILNRHKKDIMSIKEVNDEVSILLQGHDDLLVEFTDFLPYTSGAGSPSKDERLLILKRDPLAFEEVINFLVKLRDEHKYNTFLDIIGTFMKGSTSVREVYHEVSILLQDHADLLVEFTHFLPNHNLKQTDRGSRMARLIQAAALDQAVNCPDSETKLNEKEEVQSEGIDKKIELNSDDNLDLIRKSADRDDSVTDQFHQGAEDPMSTFVGKVKDRLQDTENYKKFLDCLRIYRGKIVTGPQFQHLVATILGSHTDLKEECEDFMTYIEKTELLQNNKQISRSLKVEEPQGDDHNREDNDKNKDHDNGERDRCDPKDVQGQKIGAEVLDDDWLLVTSGNEDDRHELDMLGSVSATAQRVEKLLDSSNSFHTEDNLTAQTSAASSAPRLTTNDALSYLKVVKERFQVKGDKFKDFIDTIKDFKAKRINKSGVVVKVKELFREDKDLLLRFYAFLPKGYETVTPPED